MTLHRLAWFAVTLAVAVAAVAAGHIGYRHWQAADQARQAVEELRSLRLPDPQGRPLSFRQWEGRVLVVNFWATWCEPCREEVPALVSTRGKYAGKSVEIVGIAVDSADKVREFAKQYAIDYPLAIGNLQSIDLARRLGNKVGALPYTLVLDARGQVVLAHLGGMTETQLDQAIGPLVR